MTSFDIAKRLIKDRIDELDNSTTKCSKDTKYRAGVLAGMIRAFKEVGIITKAESNQLFDIMSDYI